MKITTILILVIGMALTASCATPTTPAFPAVDCKEVKLTKSELQELKSCDIDTTICSIKFSLLKKIFNIVQENAACLEQYKAAASKFKG